jgi:ABC-type multidrug transport system ATPase subunit
MRIGIERLSKSYGRLRALDELSLVLEPGQVVALLGANGAGKTTLLRCLAGLAAPDGGRILCDGEAFRRGRIDLRRRLAFLPDFPPFYPEMNVLRHLGMVLRLYGADPSGLEERVVRLLRSLDLLTLAGMPMGALSRGQAYKAALASLVAVDPELWLFDEPFASGMDPNGITVFKDLARDAASRGRTVVYSTQLLDLAERFSDRVVIIDRGRLSAFDTVEALRARAGGKDGVLEAIFRRLREERP